MLSLYDIFFFFSIVLLHFTISFEFLFFFILFLFLLSFGLSILFLKSLHQSIFLFVSFINFYLLGNVFILNSNLSLMFILSIFFLLNHSSLVLFFFIYPLLESIFLIFTTFKISLLRLFWSIFFYILRLDLFIYNSTWFLFKLFSLLFKIIISTSLGKLRWILAFFWLFSFFSHNFHSFVVLNFFKHFIINFNFFFFLLGL